MKKLYYNLIVSLTFTCGMSLHAQDGGPGTVAGFNTAAEINNQIKLPKSPEAEAFEKYGNTAVNLYSGTPDINIPLHTFKGREYNVPLSVTYDATGIKVEQIATNVGLGWNLTFGGRISRIANGNPDDVGYGPYTDDNLDGMIQTVLDFGIDGIPFMDYLYDFMTPIANGTKDTQLDYYSLNVPGISDYIAIDLGSRTAHTLLNPRIKVQKLNNEGWVVTGEDGTKYYFGEAKEMTNLTGGNTEGGISYTGYSTTSWLLNKIVSKNGLDEFDFSYQMYQWNSGFTMKMSTMNFQEKLTCPLALNGGASWNLGADYKTSQAMPLELRRNGEILVKFNYKSREDLLFSGSPYQGGNALDEIEFYNYKDVTKTFKKIKFDHTYFGPSSTTSYKQKRLKLNKLTIYRDNIATGKTYQFTYINPQDVPSTDSNAQDFLGLFNDHSASSLIPRTHYGPFVVGDADRSPNSNVHTNGTLKRIYYPTGGYTEFDYEQNRIPNNTTVDEHVVIDDVEFLTVGGDPNSFCIDAPPQYNTLHPSMTFSLNAALFGCIQIGNPTMMAVQTTLLTIDQTDTYYMDRFGDGYYLIQKITGCNNPSVEHDPYGTCYHTDSQGNEIPIDYYPCLRPTNTIYMTSPSNVSQPTDFVNGGCIYGGDRVTLPNLAVGTYQVTLWKRTGTDENGYQLYADPMLKFYKKVPRTVPTTTYYDSKAIEGFRVLSIKDYSDEGVFAQGKIYQYTMDFNPENLSGIQLGEAPAPKVYQTKNYACSGSGGGHECRSIANVVISSAGIRTIPHVGYESVFEINVDNNGNTNGYTQSKFHVGASGIIYASEGAPSFEPKFENGKVYEKNVYDTNQSCRQREKNFYDETEFIRFYSLSFSRNAMNQYAYYNGGLQYHSGACNNNTGQAAPGPLPPPNFDSLPNVTWSDNMLGRFSYYPVSQMIIGKYGFVTQKETTTYPDQGVPIVKNETFEYDPFYYLLQAKTTTTSVDTEPLREEYTYDENYPDNPEKITDIVTSRAGNVIFKRKNIFTDFGSSANLLTEIRIAKGTGVLEPRIKFEYDPIAKNLITTHRDVSNSDVSSFDSYIFAYNDMFPVAKISGAKYSTIPTILISDIKDFSNVSITETSQNNMRDALQALRTALPDAQVTTYIYNPDIGLTRQTDPKEVTTYFEYDEMNRLERVRDNEQNILSENKYNYRPTPNP
jgi:hypothetical protein